jgi:phosphoglycolate phosphatase-like HAD superfamily hydrolase
MTDPLATMQNHVPKHEFFIAIDSDGCAFDTMEIKHKECFIPNIIKYWNLQAVSKYARAAAEFVNLYSKWRGINRFPALIMVFDLLKEWDKVTERHVKIPEAPNLRAWCKAETKLGNPALKAYCETHGEPDMHQSLAWSKAVNVSVADIVKGVPPFPYVRESLQKGCEAADILVCSATPGEALMREWQEHCIDQYAFAIAGQEVGSKAEHIAISANGKYAPAKMLMIGDAPGDLKAAKANKALFFPINPGDEEDSWKLFYEEALDKFIAGQYAGEYEAALIKKFETYLPETPPWKKCGTRNAECGM